MTTAATTTTSTTLPHFECYEVGRVSSVQISGVTVQDRYGTGRVDVRRPRRICNPADKNGENPDAAQSPEHLTSFEIRPEGRPGRVMGQTVTNQFGSITVDLIRPDRLLVPTAKSKTGLPPPLTNPTVDHFKCYRIRRSASSPRPARTATIVDQFGTWTVSVRNPVKFCTPADKNGEDPTAPHDPGQLLCYRILASPFFQNVPIFVANQFGPANLEATRPAELCVPSTVSP